MSKEKKIDIKKEKSKKNEGEKSRELSIKRKNPFSLFQRIDRIFDNLTSSLFDDWYWPFSYRRSRPFDLITKEKEPFFRTPLTNISEDDKNFNIKAELPGLTKDDIEILIRDGNLEIKGGRKEEKKEEKEGQLVRREYHSSNYYRCFSLPENVDADAIDAKLDNGILNVIIPKKEPAIKEKKKIEIK